MANRPEIRKARALQLRPDVLEAPNIRDVAIVETTMLWPHDEERRTRAMEAVVLRILRAADSLPIPKSAAEASELAGIFEDAPRLSDFAADAKVALLHGVIAGRILFDAIGGIAAARTKADVVRKLGESGRFRRLKPKTIDNFIWPTYRPVSPFWAAWLYCGDPQRRFPCDPPDLAGFLATADAFRRRGEATRSPRSPAATILRKDESILVPPGIALAEVELTFG